MALVFVQQREATFKDGCTSLRKSVLDKLRVQSAPGCIYNPKPRVSSKERSLRDITFGTSPARYNDEPEHNKRRGPKRCRHPGPQTYDPSAIRKAMDMQSNQRSTPSIKFSTGKRDPNVSKVGPSPAEYDPEMIRRGIMFSKSGSTYVKFGTAINNDSKPCFKPGPATYNPEAIQRGVMLSSKSKMPSVKFGDPPKKKKQSRNADNQLPGPTTYDTECIRRGIYSLSNKKRPAGVKFSTGPRMYNNNEKERTSKPGPSSYEIPSALGQQYNSRYKSQPSISFGAR